MKTTISISDLALMMWRFWKADTSEYMPREVFYQYISSNGFRFKEEDLFLTEFSIEDDADKAAWHVAKYGDVEDAFIEHVNSEGSFNSLAKFTEILSLYVEPQPVLQGINAVSPSLVYSLSK